MALFKNTTASASYVVTTSSTTTTFTPIVEASVQDGQLVPGPRVTKPGVFTAGTPGEGSITRIDSNG